MQRSVTFERVTKILVYHSYFLIKQSKNSDLVAFSVYILRKLEKLFYGACLFIFIFYLFIYLFYFF